MNTEAILSALDQEIRKLQQVRAILSGYQEPAIARRGPGRPKKVAAEPVKVSGKRNMSPEARARIAEAQRKRWAAAKRAAK